MAALSKTVPTEREAVDRDALPELARRWLKSAGVPWNRPSDCESRSVFLRQVAELRRAPTGSWQPLACEQVIAIRVSGFVWDAKQRLGPFSLVRVVDAFVDGHGFLEARLFGSVRVGRLSGPEADKGELMRYLAELAWAPDAAACNPAIRWRSLDQSTLELEADSAGGVARVRLYLDQNADLVEMQADERASSEGDVVVTRPWRGFFSQHREIGGRRVPTRGEVGYVYDDGYSAYWRGSVVEYQLR